MRLLKFTSLRYPLIESFIELCGYYELKIKLAARNLKLGMISHTLHCEEKKMRDCHMKEVNHQVACNLLGISIFYNSQKFF